MRLARTFVISFLALFSVLTGACASDQPLPMHEAFVPSVAHEDAGVISVTWQIRQSYYLYRDYLSATTGDGQPIALETIPGTKKEDPNFGSTEVYYDTAKATFRSDARVIRLTYQGCQEHGLCYPPVTQIIDASSLEMTEEDPLNPFSSAVREGNGKPRDASSLAESAKVTGLFKLADTAATTQVDTLMADGGLAWVLLGFLGFGALLAFTPCVFPMYPIVAAMLAHDGERLSPTRSFTLSSAYVLGLAVAFGLLGMVAAWSGQNLQIALQSRAVILAVGLIFVILALSNFGLFELQLPASIRNRFSSAGRQRGSFGGAAVLGFSSAAVVGPCVTAPLAGALLYIARTGDVLVGALALFFLGIGKGIPLIAIATLGGGALPKAGAWMENVRHLFGFMFLGTAIWLVAPTIPEKYTLLPWAVLAISFAVFSGVFNPGGRTGRFTTLTLSIGFVSLLWGGLLFVGFSLGSNDPLQPLSSLKERSHTSALQEVSKMDFSPVASLSGLSAMIAEAGKPTLVYVTADWCVTCRTIERTVFKDPQVATALTQVELATVDVSNLDEEKQRLLKTLEVVGPPTMLFLNSDSAEPAGTRLVGDIDAPALARAAAVAAGVPR